MLARLERSLPRGEGWRYEPKLDGFRGLLWRAPSGSVHLLSRNKQGKVNKVEAISAHLMSRMLEVALKLKYPCDVA